MKKNNGITLVALIITIIVMIILAGITIALTIGNDGIFNKAKSGGKKYQSAQDSERTALNNLDSEIGIVGNNGEIPVNNKYYIIEVYDQLNQNGSAITELDLFKANNDSINYTIEDHFDSYATTGESYWDNDGDHWGKSNLYDDDLTYTTIENGPISSTLFYHESNPGTGNWARFVIKAADASKMTVYLGGPEGRLPETLKVYKADSYTAENVNTRTDTGLTLVDTLEFYENVPTVTPYDINL